MGMFEVDEVRTKREEQSKARRKKAKWLFCFVGKGVEKRQRHPLTLK